MLLLLLQKQQRLLLLLLCCTTAVAVNLLPYWRFKLKLLLLLRLFDMLPVTIVLHRLLLVELKLLKLGCSQSLSVD